MANDTMQNRIDILKRGKELWLRIEGRYTNLRIWTGKDEAGKHPPESHDTVFMRIDKAKEYSVPLEFKTVQYLLHKDRVSPLLRFGFKSSINNLDEILKLTSGLEWCSDSEIVRW